MTHQSRSRRPSDGERAFAWVFSVVYISLIAVVAAVVAVVIMSFVFAEAPTGLGFVLALAVYGMTPHAAATVADTLAGTRDLPPGRRLLRILGAIHG